MSVRWAVVAVAGAACLALGLAVRQAGPVGPDLSMVQWLQGPMPALDGVATAVSLVGQPLFLAIALALGSAWLWRWGRRTEGLVLLGALGVEVLVFALRLLTDRSRPTAGTVVVLEQGFGTSYPSGHASTAAAIAVVAAALYGGRRATRVGVLVALSVFVLAEGWSRLYLGAHWPSDVLGGYLLGGAYGIGLASLVRR